MKLPAAVRIGPYRWTFARCDGSSHFGQADPNTHTIEIAESDAFSSEALEASTVLHEMAHAIITVYGIKVPDEEALVGILETALVQVLKDNKTLFRTILRALK